MRDSRCFLNVPPTRIIHQLDPNWTLPSRLADNPIVWMLQVNGFLRDIRHAPREVQEIAFNKGLIPYVPADR